MTLCHQEEYDCILQKRARRLDSCLHNGFETKGREEAGNTGSGGPRILKGVPYSSASINQIIKEADISRGGAFIHILKIRTT